MRPQQAAYYNASSYGYSAQRPTKIQSESQQQQSYSAEVSQGPPQSMNYASLNQQSGYGGYQSSFSSNQSYGNISNQSYPPSYNEQQKKGGYTEAEIKKLRGQGNEEREEYDLGKDGAFNDFSVLVGCFYHEVKGCWDSNAGKALSQKGFRVTLVTDEKEFITQLRSEPGFDVAWIVSSSTTTLSPADQQDFKSAVLNFHRSGRGLFIYGDNDPYHVQANWVLPDLVGTTIAGCTPGQKVLGYGKANTPGEFDAEHLIFGGINYLYEGHTICWPQTDGRLTHLATSSDGRPCISFLDSTEEHGRVLLDNGFTKLYLNWDSAGQARYVVNGTVYLTDVERRFDDNLQKIIKK